jgi:hypothetical protein
MTRKSQSGKPQDDSTLAHKRSATTTTSSSSSSSKPPRPAPGIFDDADEDEDVEYYTASGRVDSADEAELTPVQPKARSTPKSRELSKKEREIRNIKAALRNEEFDIELDFPEDGYDYMKHIRTAGSGTFLPRAGLENFFTSQQHKQHATRDDEQDLPSDGKIVLPSSVVALDDALEPEYLEDAMHGMCYSLRIRHCLLACSAGRLIVVDLQ